MLGAGASGRQDAARHAPLRSNERPRERGHPQAAATATSAAALVACGHARCGLGAWTGAQRLRRLRRHPRARLPRGLQQRRAHEMTNDSPRGPEPRTSITSDRRKPVARYVQFRDEEIQARFIAAAEKAYRRLVASDRFAVLSQVELPDAPPEPARPCAGVCSGGLRRPLPAELRYPPPRHWRGSPAPPPTSRARWSRHRTAVPQRTAWHICWRPWPPIWSTTSWRWNLPSRRRTRRTARHCGWRPSSRASATLSPGDVHHP